MTHLCGGRSAPTRCGLRFKQQTLAAGRRHCLTIQIVVIFDQVTKSFYGLAATQPYSSNALIFLVPVRVRPPLTYSTFEKE